MSHVCGCNTGDAQTRRRRLAEIAASESPRFQREDRTDRCQREKREGRRRSRTDRVNEIKRKLDAAKDRRPAERAPRQTSGGNKEPSATLPKHAVVASPGSQLSLTLRLPFDPESSLPDSSPDAPGTVRPTGRAEQHESLPTQESVTIGSASEGQ